MFSTEIQYLAACPRWGTDHGLSAHLGGRLATSAPGQGERPVLLAPQRADDTRPPATPRARAASSPSSTVVRPLTILLADDHARVRAGLRDLLSDRPELQVVGEAADGQEALDLTRSLRPDVVVMDVSMPGVDGIEATRRILAEQPTVQIFGLSIQERSDQVHTIVQAGAADYFSKSEEPHRLLQRLLETYADKAMST